MKKPKQSFQVLSTLALAASEAREDTLQSVILNTIYEKQHVKRSELIPNIKSIYLFEPYKPEVELLLEKLIKDDLIVLKSEDLSLSETEKNKLSALEIEIRDGDSKRFLNFKNFITDTLEKNIEINKIKLLYSVFVEYLYNSFYEFGTEALDNFVSVENKPDLDNEDFIQEAYTKLKDLDGSLCEIFKLVVDKFPDFVSKEDLFFLNEISLKTQSFVSLGAKPEEAQEISDMNLIDWVLYLDTNVIYSLLHLHSHPENEACKALIKLINDNSDIIKIKLRYSELTFKELLNKQNDFNLLDDKLSNSAIQALLKSDKLDAFSREFYTNLLNNRGGTLHPSKIIDISNITLKAELIEVSRSSQKFEKLGDDYLETKTQDYLRYIQTKNDIKADYCKQKKIHFNPHFRSDKQAYHDVGLRELIIDYRYSNNKSDSHLTFNNIKYFAITLDDLLIQFDQYERRNQIEIKGFPVFFKPSFLLNKLAKLLPIKTEDYKKAYFKAVTSRGFNKDIRKSDDIQKIATYLKQRGVDNKEVVYDLISQDLFLEKYHKAAETEDFNQSVFIEDELNRQFKEKEAELEKSKKELDNVKTTAITVSGENNELNKKITELTSQLGVYSKAAETLSKKVTKLEKQTAPKVVHHLGLNFEAAEKQEEIEKLKGELNRHKADTLAEKQETFKERKLRNWQLRSFIPSGISLIILAIILYINDWNFSFVTKLINSETQEAEKVYTSLGLAFLVLILNIFVIAHIYQRYFNESNKKAYYDRIKLPKELKN